MTGDILDALPARRGHFLLESGYHTDLWLTLDAMFVDPAGIAPLVSALAEKLRPHGVTAVCGPLLGGAFLAQALATALGVAFYHAEPVPAPAGSGLFKAEYRLPDELRRRVRGERVAVVDDVISAGSSVRATIAALVSAGASVPVVAAPLVLGDAAVTHFAQEGVPMEMLGHRDFSLWKPDECPLCREGTPLEDPRMDDAAV
jgi:orotate phosphoribosyltransferase